MTSTARRYSLANPPPTQGELDGRETAHEAEILEVQALQAEHDGDRGRSIQLMERAMQIRCHVVNQLREKWASAPDSVPPPVAANESRRMSTASVGAMGKDDVLREYQAQCGDLYDAAERLVVCCNVCGVEHFKKDAFAEAAPLLEYALQLTDEEAYPLCEVEERRRHLRGVTLNNLGCMERRRGHFSPALNYMKASMEMTGVESPVAYMNLSAILIQLRLNDEAVRMAERSITLLSQTPEDPSLLAVAHHNLAMALEPVDAQRCAEEYELAYRIACTTVGKDSSTSQAIQHSWQRFERTHAPALQASGRYFAPQPMSGGGGKGFTSSASRATSPQRDGVFRAAATPPPADAAEIFPHPFVLTASVPRQAPAPGKPFKAASAPSRPTGPPPRRVPRERTPEKTFHRPSPPPTAHSTSSSSRSNAVAARASARNGGSSRADGHSSAGFVPSPPSHGNKAAVSRRFSPSRAADSASSSARAAGSQRRLSEQNTSGSGKKIKGGHRLSPLKSSTTRSTASSNSNAYGTQPKPSRVPGRMAGKNAKGTGPTPSPPPRLLPPLQTIVADSEPSTSKKAPRPSRDTVARASASQHRAPGGASVEDNPLVFLQNRLDVLLQDEEELEQKYAQANVIQRHYRGHLARRQVAELRALRARDARLADLRRRTAARQIQQSYRRHRRHRRRPFGGGPSSRYAGGRRSAQHHAATQLQRVARGWLARRRFAKLRQFVHDSPLAAVTIQRWYRGVHAQRSHAALRAEKAQREAEMREEEQQQYAATRIQGQWRAYTKRKAYETDLRNRMMARAAEDAQLRVKSAVRIQSAWRGSQARRLYRNTFSRSSQLRNARQEYEQRRHAAVKLQSFGRMIIVQQRSLPQLTAARLRAAHEINTRSREGRAAQTIQCAYRSHAARRLYAAKKSERVAQLRRGLAQVQAMVLQRVGRGYATRKSIGAEGRALQDEAERYERRLRALEHGDVAAARDAKQKIQQMLSDLQAAEGDDRRKIAVVEPKERHIVQHHCEIAAQNLSAAEKERQARRDGAIPILDNFARVLKAKQQRAQRQSARDAYLDRCCAAEEAAHEDARASQEAEAEEADEDAAEPGTETEEREEKAEEARAASAEEQEPSMPDTRRPLTAQQIAAERTELDRLTAAENVTNQNKVLDESKHNIHQLNPAQLERKADCIFTSSDSSSSSTTPVVRELRRPTSAEARVCLRGFVRSIQDRKELRRRQASRDAYVHENDDLVSEEDTSINSSTAEVQPASVPEVEEASSVAAAEKERQARRDGAILILDNFARVLKAKQQRAQRQSARDAYLDRCCAAEEAAHEDARASQEAEAEEADEDAAEPGTETEEREEKAEEARAASAEEQEPSMPDTRRPLTAQQIAAERTELDRLTAAENEADQNKVLDDISEAGVDDELATSALERELMAQQKAVWQAEEKANKKRRQDQEALHKAMFDYKQQRIAAAEKEKDLVPYARERVRLQKRFVTDAALSDAKARRATPDEASAQNIHRQQRLAQERDAAHAIHRYYTGYKARQQFAALLHVRDEYLAAKQELERNDGPVLVSDRLREVRARHPQMEVYQRKPVAVVPSSVPPQENHAPASSSLSAAGPSDVLDNFARVVKAKQQRAQRQSARDAYLDRCCAAEEAAHEDARASQEAEAEEADEDAAEPGTETEEREEKAEEARAASAEEQEPSMPDTRRPLTAQQIAAERTELDRLTAAENEADQNKVLDDISEAGVDDELATSALEAEENGEGDAAVSATPVGNGTSVTKDSTNDAERSAAALKVQQCFRQTQARRALDALRQAYLESKAEEIAVGELLDEAALTIQCVYRGHRARQQAAMATVQRDLYLLSLQAQADVDAAEDGEEEEEEEEL
ncbi:hypothetical protein ABB37_01391 [Leptomonas pyrrhocoris]|uniref:Uncharacterized protein n=1 Tax=Leptomonas pyrrhocoris TaxID=157538 RepID=A0A0M9G8Y1_LEPPY|nr:hypothetical protein ABB37_01391 [Leptomonas pyrrhocoris]KPA84949.1 hypothetical protein ABB37_01391 [Leptomonas pyrrhocoris]|eukprot:XP_015663388.1 hypothetical protein ABB37_01391 [Leptomonas pyrrhocoris]